MSAANKHMKALFELDDARSELVSVAVDLEDLYAENALILDMLIKGAENLDGEDFGHWVRHYGEVTESLDSFFASSCARTITSLKRVNKFLNAKLPNKYIPLAYTILKAIKEEIESINKTIPLTIEVILAINRFAKEKCPNPCPDADDSVEDVSDEWVMSYLNDFNVWEDENPDSDSEDEDKDSDSEEPEPRKIERVTPRNDTNPVENAKPGELDVFAARTVIYSINVSLLKFMSKKLIKAMKRIEKSKIQAWIEKCL